MAKPDGAHGSLAHGGEGLGQQVVQALAGSVALAEALASRPASSSSESAWNSGSSALILCDYGLVALQLLALAHREQFGEKSHVRSASSFCGRRAVMGSAIASLLTTPVAFIGRPRGPPRCKSAPLYHRAQVARPISQGLQGGETPFCARSAPGCAVQCRPAPSRTVLRPSAPFSRRSPVRPSAPGRTPAPSHSRPRSHCSPFCAVQRRRTPAPSRSCTVTPRPFASLLQSLPLLFPTASRSKAHSHTALQSSRKSLEIDHRPISPNQMLLFFELLEFRANSHHSTP